MTVVELGSMEPDELAAAIEAAKDGWPDQWYCLPVVVEAYRTALQRELEAADSRPPLSASGRGIVICAGGPLYLTCAWVCVRRLRQLGCELPIQIWHRGPDELPEPFRRAFDTSDVEFIDALEIRKCVPMRILNGWELKAFALLCTPFAQVLMLDADNVPARDPSYLFDAPEFAATGAVVWPDRGPFTNVAVIEQVADVRLAGEMEQESGQVLVDRTRCGRALGLAAWLNGHSDFFYRHVHGDKDTFQLAFRVLRMPYRMVPHRMEERDGVFFQHDFGGDVVFQHRTGAKWDLDEAPRAATGFAGHDDCVTLIEELRALVRPAESAGRAGGDARPGLEGFCKEVVARTSPLSQNTGPGNIGFGWLYYALARNLAPAYVVAIGSARGFMPVCLARALRDNGRGRVIFIDPSYEGHGNPGWSGVGFWNDPRHVTSWFAGFGVADHVVHLKMTSEEALPHVKALIGAESVSLVVIDGRHTYDGCLSDFERYAPLVRSGFVCFHDATNSQCRVAAAIDTIKSRGYECITIDADAGLAIAQIGPSRSHSDRWGYLVGNEERADAIWKSIAPLVGSQDSVLDLYCGSAPILMRMRPQRYCGYDGDVGQVARLRVEFPQYRWLVGPERLLPSMDLPESVDVLLGLGVCRRVAGWDPADVVRNSRFALGFYRPRVAVFETATDYDDASILIEIRRLLTQLDYEIREDRYAVEGIPYSNRSVVVALRHLEEPADDVDA